jgi:ribosomal protein S18 acetylase RimI-like enzyme
MAVDPTFTIRPMEAAERPAVMAVVRRSFPLLQWPFFSFSPHTLVAESAGTILGGIVLKVFPLAGGRRGGLISWIFTGPEARGRGVGQALADAGLERLRQEGCDEVFAGVEGYNASSNKLWATRGFSPLSLRQQIDRYGWRLPAVWWHTFHLFDIGHFLWACPAADDRAERPAAEWWMNIGLNVLLMALAVVRAGGLEPATAALIPAVLAFYGVRHLAMAAVARREGLDVRYRAWDSAYLLAAGIALFLGGVFPIPGSLYPTRHDWRFREEAPRLGRMATAGGLAVLALGWLLTGVNRLAAPGAAGDWLGYGEMVAKNLAFFDLVLPFFPFASFNGRLVLSWNRVLWVVMAAAGLALFLI